MKSLPQNRTFGFFFTFVLAFVAWRMDRNVFLFILSAVVLIISFVQPHWLYPANVAWYKLGLLLGRFVSPIVLTVLYFLIFSPMALVLRMIGHKPFRSPGWVVKAKPCRFEKPF